MRYVRAVGQTGDRARCWKYRWHWLPTLAWIVLGLWHDAQGTEKGAGALPGLGWRRFQKGAAFEHSLASGEGLSRPSKVLEHGSEVF